MIKVLWLPTWTYFGGPGLNMPLIRSQGVLVNYTSNIYGTENLCLFYEISTYITIL